MNYTQEIDPWSQISIPQWIMENINHLQQPPISMELDQQRLDRQKNYNNQSNLITSQNQIQMQNSPNSKRKSPVSYQLNYLSLSSSNLLGQSPSLSDSQQQRNEYPFLNRRRGKNNNKQRRCQNSRKYRQRRKQYIKQLQQQNRFMKFKIDQLSFRLHQLQNQLNKLKNKQTQDIQNYHTFKSECLKQIQTMLSNNVTDTQQYLKMDIKLGNVVAFDGKQKINLLNYFMSQLLENVLNDKIFYFLDCLINKRGIHCQDKNIQPRKIDLQVNQILKFNKSQNLQIIKKKQCQVMEIQAIRFQELWKKLYQVYLAILNQGIKMDRIVIPMKRQLMQYVYVVDFLKLDLHFEKNKYRNDIRQMRSLWFRQLQKESVIDELSKGRKLIKKSKIFE